VKVVLNTSEHMDKVLVLLHDPAYKKLAKDPTQPAEEKTTSPHKGVLKMLRTTATAWFKVTQIVRFPKIHKAGVPLKPFITPVEARTYRLAKYLGSPFGPHLGNFPHHVRNSEDFIRTLDTLRVQPKDILVSFYVVSLSPPPPRGCRWGIP
jgi:hypothetical protein